MQRNRTGLVVGLLVVAQVGIVVGYYGVLSGGAAPPAGDTAKKMPAPKEKKDAPAAAPAKAANPEPAAPPPPDGPAADKPARETAPKHEDPAPRTGGPAPAAVSGPAAPDLPKDPSPKKDDPLIDSRPAASPADAIPPAPPSEAPKGASGEAKVPGAASPPDLATPPAFGGSARPVEEKPEARTPPPAAREVPVTVIPPTSRDSDRLVPVPACPWTLRVAIVAGKTHLIAQAGQEVRFRVVCDQANLQAPRGSIEAHGAVKLSSDGLDGSGEHLTISWQEDQVVLDGKAQLKSRRDGQDLEVKGDRLSLRLSPTGPKKADKVGMKRDSRRAPRRRRAEEDDAEESEDDYPWK